MPVLKILFMALALIAVAVGGYNIIVYEKTADTRREYNLQQEAAHVNPVTSILRAAIKFSLAGNSRYWLGS
jgi:hypothetical protein